MRSDRGGDVREGIEALQPAGLHDRQQAFDGPFALVPARAKHNLAPLNNARFILPVSVTLARSTTRGIRSSGSASLSSTLITAAAMRAHLKHRLAFSPPGLTPELARTEGWTFGIV